jgi:hypothetical protein
MVRKTLNLGPETGVAVFDARARLRCPPLDIRTGEDSGKAGGAVGSSWPAAYSSGKARVAASHQSRRREHDAAASQLPDRHHRPARSGSAQRHIGERGAGTELRGPIRYGQRPAQRKARSEDSCVTRRGRPSPTSASATSPPTRPATTAAAPEWSTAPPEAVPRRPAAPQTPSRRGRPSGRVVFRARPGSGDRRGSTRAAPRAADCGQAAGTGNARTHALGGASARAP